MHARMTVLKSPNESVDYIETMINDWWEAEDSNLSDRYNIDYYTEVNVEQGIDILKRNFGHSGCGFKYDKNTQEVTITLKGVVKYFYDMIREINSFMKDNKPVDNFVSNLYSLQLAVQPEHPKILAGCSGLVDLVGFARSVYNKMKYEHVDKVVFKVYKCYDYHF